MARIVIRVPEDMEFSAETVAAINESGMVFSRRNEFVRREDYVVLNWGSRAPINFGPRVRSAYVLNKPEDVHLSVNKQQMYNQVKDLKAKKETKKGEREEEVFVPKTAFLPRGQQFIQAIDQIGLPSILKPNVGSKGRGAKVISKPSDILGIFQSPPEDYILQQYVDAHGEYRFNFLNGELVQVSRKLLPAEKEKHPGIFDGWLSLGQAEELHKTAHRYAKTIAAAYPLPVLAVDLLRYGNKEKPNWAFCEVNSAPGLGPMTAGRIKATADRHFNDRKLEAFKVK